MIFTKEVMNNPEVERFTEIREESEDFYTVETLKKTGEWLFLMLHLALEKPSNKEWLEQFHAKNARKWKQYYPESKE